MNSARYLRALKDEAKTHGFTIAPTQGGHLRVTDPSSGLFFFAPRTPSDNRSWNNVLGDLKKLKRGQLSAGAARAGLGRR